MTIAERFAEFLMDTRYDEIADQAVDHAAMIVASTLASAACVRRDCTLVSRSKHDLSDVNDGP